MSLNPPPEICGPMDRHTDPELRQRRAQWAYDHVIKGYSQRAIARRLGVSNTTVRTAVHQVGPPPARHKSAGRLLARAWGRVSKPHFTAAELFALDDLTCRRGHASIDMTVVEIVKEWIEAKGAGK
jgi:hypothetical protein